MELINVLRDQLLRPLQIVSGIVERRHTLPILANLLIRKNGKKISFISTDIEIQITTHSEIANNDHQIDITVAARKLVDILRAIPDGPVKLSLTNKKIAIESGKSSFSLQTLDAEEFPILSETNDFGTQFNLSQKNFKQLITMVHFAMAHQDIRYYLNGMLLVIEGNTIEAVATDGHRLAYSTVNSQPAITPNNQRQEVIIPRKTIIELQRLLEDSDESIEIYFSSTQAKFKFNQIELLSKLVEGKFPDYQRVIPKNYKNTFTLERDLLQSALQRAAILTSDKFKGVRCIVDKNSFKVNSTNNDQEEAKEEIEVTYQGDAIDMGFNVTYLLDVLSNIKDEKIQFSLGDSNSSALMMIPDDSSFKYVVMPMRI